MRTRNTEPDYASDYYQRGCEAAEHCSKCPLIDCRYSFELETRGGMNESGLSVALRETWKTGARTPDLVHFYTGPISLLDEKSRLDIFDIHPTYEGESPREYAEYLGDKGLSARDISAISGVNYYVAKCIRGDANVA